MYDKTGREIQAGDLLKIPHYVEGRHRRKIFMYKLVVNVDSQRKITRGGQYKFAVDITDIYEFGSLQRASKCPLSVIGDCEIIDGGTVDRDDLFWERSTHEAAEVAKQTGSET